MIIIVALLPFTQSFANDRESTICGFFKERLLFFLWSSAAPAPNKNRISGIPDIEEITFTTSDNKKLAGYKYRALDRNEKPVAAKGYVLMAFGNAMIADQIIRYLKGFALKGYDIYLYDYRGYGKSEGLRRINAIIEDYKEITADLNKKYEERYLYGISLGGVVIMNVIGSSAAYDAAAIDSSPSRLSDYGCPAYIDPVNNLPLDSSKLLIVTGEMDQVLNDDMTKELRIEGEKRGARVFVGSDFAHPFMDKDRDTHQKRMSLIKEHLLGGKKASKDDR